MRARASQVRRVAALAPLLLVPLLEACEGQGWWERPAPNVLLVVLDTARADRMTWDGYARETTPHLDALARDAVHYRRAHSVAPWTLPAHMSMFTGLLPGQHGATWRAFARPEDMTLDEVLDRSLELADPERLLARRLQRAGYWTAAFSANAWIAPRTGMAHGFDLFYELWGEEAPPPAGVPPLPVDWGGLGGGDAGRLLRAFAERAGAGLREPWFLFFNFIDPHFPYSPPPPWRYAYSRDHSVGERLARFGFDEKAIVAGARPVPIERFHPFYDAEIRYVDAAVGRLLDWLRARGDYEDALVVVTSDHGEHLGEGGRFSHQFSVDEELLRVPLLIKYPGNAGAGRVVDDPRVSNLDVYATVLRHAEGRAPEGEARDLSDPGAFERDFLIAESYHALPFLRAHAERSASFPLEEHRVTRRVVFDANGRSVFVERDGRPELPPGPAEAGRAERAEQLRRYLAGLGEPFVRARASAMDEATLERLRALGYAE